LPESGGPQKRRGTMSSLTGLTVPRVGAMGGGPRVEGPWQLADGTQ
jgi:hypothetical protein